MTTMAEVGARIREAMPRGMTQRQLADRADMTPDALSRALNAQRGLSPIEVAAIARTLGVDTHWLITGQPDPFTLSVAARHTWDADRRRRHNPGQQDDQPALDQVVGLYRAAYPQGPSPSAELPDRPVAMREALVAPFARAFADQVELRLGVDVIRLPNLGTDYSLRIGGRGVIVLATQASWFRSNWSLAHELGHLALSHHSSYGSGSDRRIQRDERAADAFAAELLMSAQDLDQFRAIESEAELARVVWELGVSTEAVRNRLANQRIAVSHEVDGALHQSTPRLLRANVRALSAVGGGLDQIAAREQAASARRFPLALLSALQTQTELGSASPEHLAWALDVPIDDIDFPEPDDEAESEAYQRMLADRPSAAEWAARLAGRAAQ